VEQHPTQADAALLIEHPRVFLSFRKCQIRRNGVTVYKSPFGSDIDAPFLSGGAISVILDVAIINMTVLDCTLLENSVTSSVKAARVSGGAIYFETKSTESALAIYNSSFESCSAAGGTLSAPIARMGLCFGGTVGIRASCVIDIRASNFTGSKCYGGSGGLLGAQTHGGAVSVECTFAAPMTLSLIGCQFSSNFVYVDSGSGKRDLVASGGALYVDLQPFMQISSMTIANCSFIENYAQSDASTAGGAMIIRGSGIDFLSPLIFSGCKFVGNRIITTPKPGSQIGSIHGGAVSLKLDVSYASQIVFSSTLFLGNTISSARDEYEEVSGGALHSEITHSFPPQVPLDQFQIEGCNFTNNFLQGPNAKGGALAMVGVFFAKVDRSLWKGNTIQCITSHRQETACYGGAVAVQFSKLNNRLDVDDSSALFSDSAFIDNHLAFVSAPSCQPIRGGALSLRTLSGKDLYVRRTSSSLSNCLFEGNAAMGAKSGGGAVHIDGPATNLTSCRFKSNSAAGQAAEGGALFSESTFASISLSSFDSHHTSVAAFSQCDSVNSGGTLSLHGARMQLFSIINSTISNSYSARGGAIFVAASSRLDHPFVFQNVSIANSHASHAGGAIFVGLPCAAVDPNFVEVCRAIEQNVFNVSAEEYGSVCASTVVSVDSSPPIDSNSTIQVAPGQPLKFSFVYLDLFGGRVYDPRSYIIAALSNHSTSVKLHANTPQDRAIMGIDREMTFPELTITGSKNATATVEFAAPIDDEWCKSLTFRLKANFRLISCLPSHFAIDNQTCQLCPAQTYSIDGSSSHCHPCDEDGHGSESSQEYSCLMSHPDVADDSVHNDWEIVEGFYPFPALDVVEELVRCPNHACLPFQCTVRSDSVSSSLVPFNHAYISTAICSGARTQLGS
jgi:hypothetical protein